MHPSETQRTLDTARLALHQENWTENVNHCFMLKKHILSLLSFNRGLQRPERLTTFELLNKVSSTFLL